MPIYEPPQGRRPRWPYCLGYGCLAGLLLIVGAYIALVFAARAALQYVLDSTSKPIVRTGPYHFPYSSGSARASIKLPDGRGSLTYMHVLMQRVGSGTYGGNRGIQFPSAAQPSQDWPLPYCQLTSVRVGVYWHPAAKGLGPFICFRDATGESVLDLGQREIGELSVVKSHTYLGYYGYNDTGFYSGVGWDTSTGTMVVTGGNGAPAVDVTAAMKHRRYLGSIVRTGNTLTFVPAKRLQSGR